MAHKEQRDYFESVKKRFPEAFVNKKVLDIGSYDLNGTNEYLFENSTVLMLSVRRKNMMHQMKHLMQSFLANVGNTILITKKVCKMQLEC
jgi:hypothetical protein